MNLFGCKFCQDDPIIVTAQRVTTPGECHRKNFDNLLWAIITVFQVSEMPFSDIFEGTTAFTVSERRYAAT